MNLKILALGDIVGRPGRRILANKLQPFREAGRIDFVVANGENVAGGSGITPELMEKLYSYGVDVITTGDHVWKKKKIIPYMDESRRILRPANYSEKAAGRGLTFFEVFDKCTVAVLNLQGRTFMPPSECPFEAADRALRECQGRTKIILVDMHAEATSEKIAMGWFLDGRVSAVFGTHTHIQTADERILPKGTAYITELGMTGPYESVIGRRIDRVLKKFTTSMPAPFDVAKRDVRACGIMSTIDVETGKALSIERVVIREDEE
jgi:metallophosphoesterase (TIGR00282 family)